MPNNDDRSYLNKEQAKKLYDGMEHRLSSAAVYCVTPDGKLLIVKAFYKKHWSLPSGVIDANETPLEAAVRETKEEVGISLDESGLKFVSVIDRHSEELGHTYQFVFATRVTESQVRSIKLQASEIDDFALVTREEVLAENRQTGRNFGKVIYHWANNRSGYIEQTFSYIN